MKSDSFYEIKDPKEIKTIVLGNDLNRFEEIVAVARYGAKIKFSKEYIDRVNKSNDLLKKFVNENRKVYGVTTGFGKNVEFVIKPEEAEELQLNIVRSHSIAVGNPLDKEVVRSILFMMLLNTGKGYSGISIETLELIKDILNNDIVPFVPGEGSIGYLSVEGYIAMLLIGENKAWVEDELLSGKDALQKKSLKPIKLKYKEGLSLLNGTTSVTAFSALAIYDLIIASKSLDISAAMTFEALKGTIKGFDKRLHSLKKHSEQNITADKFRNILAGSEICEKYIDSNVQDAYVLRCIAQIHGSAKSMIRDASVAINNEINSVSDNPVIYPNDNYSDGDGLMGGNFDGSYISLYCDSACLAACMLGKIADKRADRLVTPNLSELPPFLVKNPGLNNGFMIPQYTIAGLFSEISLLSTPVSVQSISTCARQEEPVSLAYLASKKLYKIARKLQYISAIELMMSAQGIDFLKPLKPSTINKKVYDLIRKEVKELEEDRFYNDDVEYIYGLIKEGVLTKIIDDQVEPLTF